MIVRIQFNPESLAWDLVDPNTDNTLCSTPTRDMALWLMDLIVLGHNAPLP